MKKLIIFNWKMNPPSSKEAEQLFGLTVKSEKRIADSEKRRGLKLEFVVAPPLIYLKKLSSFRPLPSSLKLGAQDVFWEDPPAGGGAFTGEISPTMLKNLGVEYVIIGHSERRQYLKETDEMINKKVLAVLKAGLKVVLCVGEPERSEKRKAKREKWAKNYIKKQLEKDLKNISFHSLLSAPRLIIAYEPIWAIGTGNYCPPEDALEMIKFIKKFLSVKCQVPSVKVLYGGSVDGKNIENFVKYEEIDGALVGGASLKKEEVKKIIQIVSK